MGLAMPGRYLESDEKTWYFWLPLESVLFDAQTFLSNSSQFDIFPFEQLRNVSSGTVLEG